MTLIDWIILGLYASSTVGLGWWMGRRQKNTSEYFVGSGRMNAILIEVSLFATLLSTISYLAIPGEVLGKGAGISLELHFLSIYFHCDRILDTSCLYASPCDECL